MVPCQSPQGLLVGDHKGGKEVTEHLLSVRCLIYTISFNPQNNPVKELQLFPTYYWGNCGSEKLSTQPKIKHMEVDWNSDLLPRKSILFLYTTYTLGPQGSLATFSSCHDSFVEWLHLYAVKGVLFLPLLQVEESHFSALLQKEET